MKNTKCFHLDEKIPHLKNSYRRIALVSLDRHLDSLDLNDDETLIVSCNWLLWQKCMHRALHCIHYDLSLSVWNAEELVYNYYIQTNDWMYLDGKDVTLFRGVSLGRKFVRHVSLVIADYERLMHSFDALADRFSPDEFIYFDFRTDDGFLNEDERYSLLVSIAEKKGVAVTNHSDPSTLNDPDLPMHVDYTYLKGKKIKQKKNAVTIARSAVETALIAASLLRRFMGKPRKSVLMLNTQLTNIPLLQGYKDRNIFPLLLASWFPRMKNPLFVAKCLIKGILLIGASQQRLSDKERLDVDQIRNRLKESWNTPASERETFVRNHIAKYIIDTDRFYEVAESVKWADAVLDRYLPQQILTDSLQNSLSNSFMELAKQRGIPTAVTWHGLYLLDTKLEILGCDPRIEPFVDRCFTWGKVFENWLDAIDARIEKVRTGNFASANYRGMNQTGEAPKRALVLQYSVPSKDFAARLSDEYYYFAEIIPSLQSLGYSEIRFKLHPGCPKTHYYQMIADWFGFSCKIDKGGAFIDYVDWADFVIGPVMSGAMLEVMASGKPYYPVLLPPHSVNMKYLEGSRVFADLKALHRTLERREVPDPRKILNDFTSFEEIPDPVKRTWEALAAIPSCQ